jgi:hypothetical protein
MLRAVPPPTLLPILPPVFSHQHTLPPLAFFQTCATLIATLAVSLFLQVHYVERVSDAGGRHARMGPVWALLLAGVVFIGEAAALSALVHGPTRLREVLVYLALTAEGVLLISAAAQPAFTALRERGAGWARPLLVLIGIGFAVLVVAVALSP